MNINKYTEKAQEAVISAQHLAEEMNHAQIEPEHLLLALVEQQDGIVPALLRKMEVDPKPVADLVRAELSKQPAAYGGSQPALSPRLRKVTDAAQAEATRLKETSSARRPDAGMARKAAETRHVRVFAINVTKDRIARSAAGRGAQRVTTEYGSQVPASRSTARRTELAREASSIPSSDATRKLSGHSGDVRRTKNNPGLIGEIALARRMSRGSWRIINEEVRGPEEQKIIELDRGP